MLGKQLLTARLAAGKTQLQVADHLGVSYATYSGYERNRRHPKPDQIRMMAEFLNVSTDYLLETGDLPAKKSNGKPVVCRSGNETRLILCYRALDNAGQAALIAAAESIKNQPSD